MYISITYVICICFIFFSLWLCYLSEIRYFFALCFAPHCIIINDYNIFHVLLPVLLLEKWLFQSHFCHLPPVRNFPVISNAKLLSKDLAKYFFPLPAVASPVVNSFCAQKVFIFGHVFSASCCFWCSSKKILPGHGNLSLPLFAIHSFSPYI